MTSFEILFLKQYALRFIQPYHTCPAAEAVWAHMAPFLFLIPSSHIQNILGMQDQQSRGRSQDCHVIWCWRWTFLAWFNELQRQFTVFTSITTRIYQERDSQNIFQSLDLSDCRKPFADPCQIFNHLSTQMFRNIVSGAQKHSLIWCVFAVDPLSTHYFQIFTEMTIWSLRS